MRLSAHSFVSSHPASINRKPAMTYERVEIAFVTKSSPRMVGTATFQ